MLKQQTMTKEQILEKCNLTPSHIKDIVPRDGKGGSILDRTVLAMEEYAQQEVAKEREKAKKLVGVLQMCLDGYFHPEYDRLMIQKVQQSLTEYEKL